MTDPRRTREELAAARAELEASEAALARYESDDEKEQRELARAEYCWRLVRRDYLTEVLLPKLTEEAEREGEGWLFEPGVLEADGHTIKRRSDG